MKALLSVLLVLIGGKCMYASDYYWVGGTGNWNDYALHWATTSGGAVFFTSAPGNGDDVYFDQNSFSSSADNVLITGSVRCHSFNFDNSAFAEIRSNDSTAFLNISGDYLISQPLNFSFTGTIRFTGNCSIRTSQCLLNSTLEFVNYGYTATILDTLHSEDNIIIHSGLSFYTQGNVLYFNSVNLPDNSSMGNYDIDFSNSIVYLRGEMHAFQAVGTIDFSASQFILSDMARMYLSVHTPLHVAKIIATRGVNQYPIIGVDEIDTIITSALLYLEEIYHVSYLGVTGVSGANLGLDFSPGYYFLVDFIDASQDSSSAFIIDNIEADLRVQKLISAQNLILNGINIQTGPYELIDSLFAEKSITIDGFTPSYLGDPSEFFAGYIEVLGDGNYSTIHCNLLKLSPGTTHTFQPNYLSQIIDSLVAYGSPGQEITIQTHTQGLADSLIMSKNFCGDYLNLRDIGIFGGASYFAGANSSDLGGNSGWNFAACFTAIQDAGEHIPLEIFPSMNSGKVFFSTTVDQVKVFNLNGELVFFRDMFNESELDVTSLSNDFYIIEAQESGFVKHEKIVLCKK
ncbi:MAG: T9SS type A sorting domain-containing protein [Bacteroidetes bacterium]|nr:T9SS type A sorting domain-containing protein [Bacteroidota bacterium]